MAENGSGTLPAFPEAAPSDPAGRVTAVREAALAGHRGHRGRIFANIQRCLVFGIGAIAAMSFLWSSLRGNYRLIECPVGDETAQASTGGSQYAANLHFTRNIFEVAVEPVVDVAPGLHGTLRERLRPKGSVSLSTLLHAMHLFGKDYPVRIPDAGPEAPVPAMALLLDARSGQQYFGGPLALSRTRYGVRVPLHQEAFLGTAQANTQAHVGQLLGSLAQFGVPPEQELHLENGERATVGDLLRDTIANFSLNGEIAWQAIALAIYHTEREWTNKFGTRFTFDELVEELTARDPAHASCAGIHDTIAVTVIMKARRYRPLVTPATEDDLATFLQRRVATLEARQRSDGSWGPDWHLQRILSGDDVTRTSSQSSFDAVLVTGHLLEWITLLPADMRPGNEAIKRAVTWLIKAADLQSANPDWIEERYCPLVHAVRSIVNWTKAQQ